MSIERARRSVERIHRAIESTQPSFSNCPGSLTSNLARDLLESQLLARHLDLAALELRARGEGHYTITSAGHEGNVVLGRLTRPTDPTLVHYRSAALVIERARQVSDIEIIKDLLLSLRASALDPAAGGRHKVFGSRALGIIPQTSTIASHLPRAVGLAFGLKQVRLMNRGLGGAAPSAPTRHGTAPSTSRDAPTSLPDDTIVCASFGDASINHSTWLGALNAVGWAAHRQVPLPLLLVCEDNGLGLSVRSPRDWVATRLNALPHVRYFHAPGWDLFATWEVAQRAVAWCRAEQRAAILHLECARLLAHAGSDVDTSYRTAQEIAEAEHRDPVLRSVEATLSASLLDAGEVSAMERAAARTIADAVKRTREAPPLSSRRAIERALCRPPPSRLREPAEPLSEEDDNPPLTLAQGLNTALTDILNTHSNTLLFGEDVAKKGGVFGVTRGLFNQFGPARVFNTLLDEQHILGLALGTSMLGMLPIAEIQLLAFLHNAEDQLRGEAAMLPFLSGGAYDNPMIVRIAAMPRPDGVGGPFHNEGSLAVLRDVPGLVVAVPARADDATELLRSAWHLAVTSRRVVVVVEPAALYHERDLYAPRDGAWLAPASQAHAVWGHPRVYDAEGTDLCLVSYGLGVRRCLRVARRLREHHGVHARVLDLRWIAPLPTAAVLEHADETGNLLVVDDARRTGSVSEELAAAMLDAGSRCGFARVTAADCPTPLGGAASLVLPSEDEVLRAALALLDR